MEKFGLIKKILFASLLASSTVAVAADLRGDYCTGAMSGGLLVMRFAPTTDANHGTLTIFNADRRQGNLCMGPKRDYKIEGDEVSDVNGLKGTFDHNGVIWVAAPANWRGPYEQSRCEEKYVDPC